MSTFFISDLHLGHQNALSFFEGRKRFKTTLEMGLYLIGKWNSVVTSTDQVFVLGDICLNVDIDPKNEKEVREILESLAGEKICVRGNHDIGPAKKTIIDDYFKDSLGCYEYRDAVCTHIPIHPQQLIGSPEGKVYKKWKWNIHGHLHEFPMEPPDSRYINVSCENIDFTPMTYDQLMNK